MNPNNKPFFQLVLMLFCALTLTSPTLWAAPPGDYSFLSLPQAMTQSANENKPIFLYFGRYGCSTCRKMHEEVFTDAALKDQFSRDFILAYVDTESGKRIKLPNGERTTEMQFASRSRILGTPTFVYYSNEQKPLFKKAGFQSIEQMKAYNEYVAAGHYKTSLLKEYLTTK